MIDSLLFVVIQLLYGNLFYLASARTGLKHDDDGVDDDENVVNIKKVI